MRRSESIVTIFLGGILNYGQLVMGRDICDVYGGHYTYCDKGYHCCNDNTQCCADGLAAGTVIGIIFGILFLLFTCVFCAVIITKKKKFRPNQLVRPFDRQPDMTISTVGRTQQPYSGARTNTQAQNYFQNQQPYPPPPALYDQHPAPELIQPPPYSQIDTSPYDNRPPPEYKLQP